MLSEPGFLPVFLLCVLCALCVEIRNAQHRVRRVSQRTTEKACTLQMRGTSGTPRRTKRSRYRCSLPGLAGFAGLRRTEPEVPRIGSRALKLRLRRKSSIAARSKKENRIVGSVLIWILALFSVYIIACVARNPVSLAISDDSVVTKLHPVSQGFITYVSVGRLSI